MYYNRPSLFQLASLIKTMFTYAAIILNHFGKTVKSGTIYSIDSFRIDVEDYVYIIETKDGNFILYETDYMFDTNEAIGVIKTVASENNYGYTHLLSPDMFGKDQRILRLENNSRIYLAAEIETKESHVHIDPLSYGSGPVSRQ